MAEAPRETTYRFAPHPSAGFILGLRIPQILGLIIAGAAALGCLRLGGLEGLLVALAIISVAAALVLIPVRGQTIEQWAPVITSFTSRRHTARFRARGAQAGHLIALSDGDLDPQPVTDPVSMPAELADIQLLECELSAYDRALLGVAKDTRARTYTAAVRVQCRAFELLSPEERRQRLEEYGGVLASLARDDSPVRRISWIERALPGDPDALGGYLLDAKREDASLDDPPYELVSYLRLIGRAGLVAEEHELLFALQVDARRPAAKRPIQRLGGGDIGAMAVLAGEIGRLIELLDGAGITPTGVLTRRGLAAAVRDGYDPWGRRQRHRDQDRDTEPGTAAHTAWPAARDEHWSHLQTDGALHCTLWVAEWPRIDVRAIFLQPLLMRADTTRTVALCMELLGPAKAIRRAERAMTEAATEDSLRGRIGQRTSQRQRQRESAAARQEVELAHGHANVRYSAYVTVSVPDGPDARDELEAAVSRVDLQAKAAPLRLERMWGQQAVGFTFGLPFCRGLK
ncbi:SCO6880 family protein [Conexibacter sp. DBS9H8]|uniref:SCO6880 family protein n=1 Tax=Conexibacter sp. DBS9H8 TaxID=2937801 RepID=UPI00200E348C|nr:SCO6880 family protein [Conexibacter sp. DBS9H8]